VRAPVHTRRRLSAALACIGAIAVLAGVPLTYAGHVLGNSAQFSARATSLLDNPSIRALIAQRVSEQAIQSAHLPGEFEPLVSSAVGVAVRTEAFRRLFNGSVSDLHTSVFDSGSNTVTLRLANVGALIVKALRRVAPGLAAQVPPSLSQGVISISGGDFGQATRTARAIEGAHIVGVLLLIAGGIIFLIAIAQADERRRAALYVGVAILVDGLVLVAAYAVIRPIVLSRFAVGQDRGAAGAVWDAFLKDLRSVAVILAIAGAVAVLVMLVLSAIGGGGRGRARPEQRRSRPVRRAPIR
jgi:hypothetical protein